MIGERRIRFVQEGMICRVMIDEMRIVDTSHSLCKRTFFPEDNHWVRKVPCDSWITALDTSCEGVDSGDLRFGNQGCAFTLRRHSGRHWLISLDRMPLPKSQRFSAWTAQISARTRAPLHPAFSRFASCRFPKSFVGMRRSQRRIQRR